MSDLQVRAALVEAAKERRFVSVFRPELGLSDSGIVEQVGARWVLMRVTLDFRWDGFVLLRLSDIGAVHHRDKEHFWRRVLEQEGRFDDQPTAPHLSLVDAHGALSSLAEVEPLLFIEREFDVDEDGDQGDCYVGRVLDVRRDELSIEFIKTDGESFDEPFEVELEGISRVGFASDYMRMFERHAAATRVRLVH